ncbi:MAG: ABC transporter permease [Azospirillum brasilense]|nr:MAG: ABC transporter permease [Azospirillum brasilense]
MSMPLSTWAIRNPIPPIVLFLVLTVAGLVAFFKLPVNNMPSVVVPIVSVTISQPGASATEMETQVTRRVEGAIAGLQGVKHITSNISEGTSVSTIEFHLETDFDRAMNDTRDAISNIRDQLPRSILEPNVQRVEIDGGAILVFSVEAPEMRTEELSWYIDDTLSRELLSIRGVASVQRSGGISHEVTVTLDAAKLAAFGASAADFSRQLALTNIDLPGGRLRVEGTEYSLRTLGNVKTVEDLRDTRIALSGGREVRLGDIATVTDGGAEVRSITKLDGKPAVTFQIFRSKGSSEVTVGDKVEAKLAELEKTNPQITFKKIFSLVEFTEISFHSTIYTFFEGAVLTILVVFLFLRDKRATLLAAITIPLSIIPTFLCMYFLGFTLNAVSLLAISLVTGVLVDDAIVEIENIHRHMKEGRKPYDAAMIAADEIGLAVVATTLVICAVFAPVSFMGGLAGQFFIQFGLTVSIAAFFSLVVARLLTPMLAAYLLKAPNHHDDKPSRFADRYHRLVEWTLGNRLKTLGIAALSMVFSFSLVPFLSTGFIPYEDYSQSRMTIELPRGATVEQTDAAAGQVKELLKQQPEVMYVLSSVAGGSQGMSSPTNTGGGAAGVNIASLDIKLVPKGERSISQRDFENRILPELKKLPDMRIEFANSAGAKDIMIALVSEDTAALSQAAEAIEREMRGLTGISSVGTSASLQQPEIVIVPDFAKAAELGISVQALSDAVNIATIGDIEANLAKFNYGNRQIPIRVRLAGGEATSLDTIRNLHIPTASGGSVPLSAVAEIRFGFGPTSIERYDRQRKIALEANLNGIPLGKALEEIYALPSMKNLPPSVKVLNTGDAEVMAELFASFLTAIGAGLMMVYAIQVLLYKDFIQPFTRMAALPLSIGGAFLMLLLTGTDLNMPAVIGILMLMGIADKNSILLVDYMLEMIHAGVPRREAIMRACEVRARPIIMTSLAMLAGMIPIALGLGLDTAFRAPMAIAVIGGLISSTALSLIFVPVLFDYVRDFEEWITPKLKRLL